MVKIVKIAIMFEMMKGRMSRRFSSSFNEVNDQLINCTSPP